LARIVLKNILKRTSLQQ